jgi:hypothetical protein
MRFTEGSATGNSKPLTSNNFFMGIVAGVIAAGVLGAGAEVEGSSQQSAAIKSAANTNANSQTALNNSNWGNYLLTRGISDPNPVAGVMPAAGTTTAVNTKLPIWATAGMVPAAGTSIAPGGGLAPVAKPPAPTIISRPGTGVLTRPS